MYHITASTGINTGINIQLRKGGTKAENKDIKTSKQLINITRIHTLVKKYDFDNNCWIYFYKSRNGKVE